MNRQQRVRTPPQSSVIPSDDILEKLPEWKAQWWLWQESKLKAKEKATMRGRNAAKRFNSA